MSGLMPRRRVEPAAAADRRRDVERQRVRERAAYLARLTDAERGRQRDVIARDHAQREQADQERRGRARRDNHPSDPSGGTA